MVKIYLKSKEKGPKKFVEISFWSMIKAYLLSAFTVIGLILGALTLYALILP